MTFVIGHRYRINVEYESSYVTVVLLHQRGKSVERLTADCVLSQCWELLCLSRCLYITSTQQQRDPLLLFFSLFFSTRAAVLAVDEKKENIFAPNVTWLFLSVSLFFFFFFCCVFFFLFFPLPSWKKHFALT